MAGRGHITRRAFLAGCALALAGCAQTQGARLAMGSRPLVSDAPAGSGVPDAGSAALTSAAPDLDELRAAIDLVEIYHDDVFVHGDKPAEFQRYIVMHDTEGTGSPESVVAWWASNGRGVAAHFVVGRDGHVVQCVPLDAIAHHAGYGDTGHNELFGVEDESRDDKVGTRPVGSWASDYGMNSYSVGIEMVHDGSRDRDYPEAQLDAVDAVIAYIDAYFGFESRIIDHNDWRTGNSDCSPEFQGYLANLQHHRTHDEWPDGADASGSAEI